MLKWLAQNLMIKNKKNELPLKYDIKKYYFQYKVCAIVK